MGPFLQFIGQVKEWFISELRKFIRMSHVLPCPMILILLCDRFRQGEVLERMIIFRYLWPLWSVSSEFWAGPGADHTIFYRNKESLFYSWVPNCFSFLGHRSRQGGVLKLKKNGEFWAFLAVWVLFSNFCHRSRSGLFSIAWSGKNVTSNYVPNWFYFAL